jgi:hypothetical protein
MASKLYWFDCDFDLVDVRNKGWLDSVLKKVGERVNCEPVFASHPNYLGGALNWADVYHLHPPTSDSIILIHGRTAGVRDALEALWTHCEMRVEQLPQCRIVYSGGGEWSHLAQTFFEGSHERYCRIKANSFKWSSEQLRPEDKVGEHFANIVESFLRESKSPQLRLQDVLLFSIEQVFEAGLGTAATIMGGGNKSNTCQDVMKALRKVSDAANESLIDWPDKDSPERVLLTQIDELSAEELHQKYARTDCNEIDPTEVFRDLFRGDTRTPSLYQVLESARSKTRS